MAPGERARRRAAPSSTWPTGTASPLPTSPRRGALLHAAEAGGGRRSTRSIRSSSGNVGSATGRPTLSSSTTPGSSSRRWPEILTREHRQADRAHRPGVRVAPATPTSQGPFPADGRALSYHFAATFNVTSAGSTGNGAGRRRHRPGSGNLVRERYACEGTGVRQPRRRWTPSRRRNYGGEPHAGNSVSTRKFFTAIGAATGGGVVKLGLDDPAEPRRRRRLRHLGNPGAVRRRCGPEPSPQLPVPDERLPGGLRGRRGQRGTSQLRLPTSGSSHHAPGPARRRTRSTGPSGATTPAAPGQRRGLAQDRFELLQRTNPTASAASSAPIYHSTPVVDRARPARSSATTRTTATPAEPVVLDRAHRCSTWRPSTARSTPSRSRPR